MTTVLYYSGLNDHDDGVSHVVITQESFGYHV